MFWTGWKYVTHRNDHGRKSKWVTLPSPSGASHGHAHGSSIPEGQSSQHFSCSSGGCIRQGFLQETLESQKRSESGEVKHQSLKELPCNFSKKTFTAISLEVSCPCFISSNSQVHPHSRTLYPQCNAHFKELRSMVPSCPFEQAQGT